MYTGNSFGHRVDTNAEPTFFYSPTIQSVITVHTVPSLSLSVLTCVLLYGQGSLVSRVVHHFQFTTWPENGAPEEGAGMIDLIGQVLRVQQQTGDKPIIVHCRYRNQNRYVITKPLLL